MSERLRLTARWIFPVFKEPLADGYLEIEDGRIVDLGHRDGRAGDARTIDLGQVALIPGLVNAHAHCEFSDLQQPLEPAQPFTQWIGRLMAHRRARITSTERLVSAGLSECWQTGSAIVGEIATVDWPLRLSDESRGSPGPRDGRKSSERPGLTVVAFRECIAPTSDRVAAELERANAHLAHCQNGQHTRQNWIAGLSPHAPYTVVPELFDGLLHLAQQHQVPLALHLAETRDELEFLQRGTGLFRDMLDRLGLWNANHFPIDRRPLDYLQSLASLPRSLAVHGNYLDDDDIQFLSEHPQIAVVYCPRTHEFFGHMPHRWQELLDRGASVAIGTDGRSSNPDYSMWNELRFLDRQTQGRCRPRLLSLGTELGARALGLEDRFGTFRPGQVASISVVPLNHTSTDAWSDLFSASECRSIIPT